MDDFIKDLKFHVYERLRSPLITSFIFSWFSWNFSTVILLLGTGEFSKKITTLGKIYPSNLDYFFNGLLYPLLSSFLFILIYPFLARLSFIYWNQQLAITKARQVLLEDKTPMTLGDVKELKLRFYQRIKDYEIDIDRLQLSNQTLKRREKELETQINEYIEVNFKNNEELSKLQDEIKALNKDLNDIKKKSSSEASRSTTNKSTLATTLKPIKSELEFKNFISALNIEKIDENYDLQLQLRQLFNFVEAEKLTWDEMRALLFITANGGTVELVSLQNKLILDEVTFTAVLVKLDKKGLISRLTGRGIVKLREDAVTKLYDAKISSMKNLKELFNLIK